MPNIIFYFSDQQRADTITPEITPNLCRLASEGVKYENNVTCQPVCGPARSCIQSGLYATQTGCFRNGEPLPPNIRPLADYFNKAGYETAYIGKWHLASDFLPMTGFHCEKTAVPKEKQGRYLYWRAADVLEFTSHGYDGYVFDSDGRRLDFTGYRADAINDFAMEFIENRDKSKPFFMFVSQLEPHHQNDRHRFEGYKETVDDFRDFPIPEDLSFLRGDYEESYPDYLSAINRLDYNVGRLVDKLKEEGIYDDTVIIYSSDHGCHFKTRNAEYKRTCHENTIKTPLIISGGAYKGGKTVMGLTGLIDLPPTFLSLAGITVPSHFMGRVIPPDETGTDPYRSMYIQISESQCGRAVRTGRYMYSVRAPLAEGFTVAESKVYIEDFFYDLELDPFEKNNLVADPSYKQVRAMLKKELLRHIESAGESRPVILPAVKA